jgi:hypothetical protein
MGEDQIRKLELRIKELEDQLQTQRQPKAADISANEVQAFLKVRDMLRVDWGDFCGINDCLACRLCGGGSGGGGAVCRVCRACIVECTCGPCNIGPFAGGGISRFEQLGG